MRITTNFLRRSSSWPALAPSLPGSRPVRRLVVARREKRRAIPEHAGRLRRSG